MAKTVAKQEIQAVVQMHGANPFTLTLKEAASQTFVKGELVEIVAGYVKEIASATTATIYGVAAEDAHNGASDGLYSVSVELAAPQQLFAANVLTTGLTDRVLLQTDLGCDMAIQLDTVNSKVYLDASTKGGANIRVRTHKQARGTDVGDTNGRALFTFKPNWVQFLGTS